MKNLFLMASLLISTSILAQSQDFCQNISLKKDCVESITFQDNNYLPADSSLIKEEHQKVNYFMVSPEDITLAYCGESVCCVDSFSCSMNEDDKNNLVFDSELYLIVFDKEADIITFYKKNESLYYQYEVAGECDF